MKDCGRKSLEAGRPQVSALQAINHCLEALFLDKKRSIHEELVESLTYEELIGALLMARDLAEETDA